MRAISAAKSMRFTRWVRASGFHHRLLCASCPHLRVLSARNRSLLRADFPSNTQPRRHIGFTLDPYRRPSNLRNSCSERHLAGVVHTDLYIHYCLYKCSSWNISANVPVGTLGQSRICSFAGAARAICRLLHLLRHPPRNRRHHFPRREPYRLSHQPILHP